MQSWLSGVVLAENVGLGALHSTMFLAKLCGLWMKLVVRIMCPPYAVTLGLLTGPF